MSTAPEIDAFRLRRDAQGRVLLEFGRREAAATPGAAPGFAVHQRIAMPELTAWRLLDGLSTALQRPLAGLAESAAATAAASATARTAPPAAPAAPGSPSSASVPATAPASVTGRVGASVLDLGADEVLRKRGTTPLNLPPDPMAEAADRLRAAVREMAPEHYEERSFRIAPQSLQANRFLLSIGARQMPPRALERAWAVARDMGLPEALRPQVEAAHAAADHLHFGFEGEPGRVMCKLYFERSIDGRAAAQARASGEPVLQYEAIKWNVDSGAHVVSHYHWHAGLSVPGIAARVAEITAGGPPALRELAQAVLDLAAPRVAPERLMLLEVAEAGEPRRSFDLNLYDARLQVRDLQPVLFAMRDLFEIRPGQFQALYDQVKTRAMGHLAGGIHRDGRPFFNVYFGGQRQH